ncbi:Splicing factor [Kalmusia sp. IMI 367209]|nr:Splicing factor [Kalmusia sp. IMI 367209]
MDINSLLSPQDSPAQETPPPHPALGSPSLQSSSKRAIRQIPSRTPSGLSQQITSSPQPHLSYQQLPSPGTTFTNGSRGIRSATGTPPERPMHSPRDARMTPPNPLLRQASTPGMDTLADLAAMQHQQQAARQNSVPQRPTFSLQNIPRTISGGSTSDISMRDSSPQIRNFAARALAPEHVDYLTQLDKSLSENPLDYYSHVSFVTTLHQGLQYHMTAIDPGNPRSYELLPILQDANARMAKKYPLGEVLWEYRLEDEKALATNVEDRMAVLEMYKMATQDEPASAKIWVAYGEYLTHLLACSWEQHPPEQWSEEEKAIGRELFTPQLLQDIWRQGAENVKYNLQDSSLVWDRYLQFLQDDLERCTSNQERQDKAIRVTNVFHERLTQPHAAWGDTLSKYASFISRVGGNTEEAMEQAVQQNTHIKQQYANREEFEFKLLQAAQQGDKDAEYYAFTRYLKWEKKTMGVYSFPLVNALFERATLRFPVDSTLWEDHIEFLIWQQDRSVDLLDVLERATRHCPWSGALWSHRILTLEAEQRDFNEIEGIKHTATGTGLLEHADLEELVKVQIAWCGYLRRRAFDINASEDDADVAEVGIRSALELVREVGMNKYGRDWPGDSSYRLERIHIKFWLQRGNPEAARQIWNSLVNLHKDSYDFWYRYYIWEMVWWSNHAVRDKNNAGLQLLAPTRATAVLEHGMQQLHTIDQPEPLIEMYVNHCEQHETVLEVRRAQIERRRSERIVAIRRQKEAAAAAAAAAATQSEQQIHAADGSGKRKREDELERDSVAKKTRPDASGDDSVQITPTNHQARQTSEVPSDAGSFSQKRDRENTSIIVQRLPQSATQTQIRKFFSDAGTVRNVTMKPEHDNVVAIIEFETPEEADYALTKEAKGFEGQDITIKRSQSTTLYVANYPPHADEAFIRKIFEPFGEILNTRFPSLKFNTHRRFCYVQFANADDAVAATKLDGTDVEGLKLIAKISNPNAKKKRDGATAEGREVYVWHLNFRCKKREIQEAFAQFGKIDRVNIPTLVNGNNKGFGYIVYEAKEDADAAVAGMNGKDFWGLDLKVEIAHDRGDTKPKIKSTIENVASTERESTTGETTTTTTGTKGDRTIALLNVPDTVNDVRIKPLVEPYGYKKITLMPQHGGAYVEFSSVEQAGKAEIALQGIDFEGRKLRIGRYKELLEQKGEWKAGNSFVQPARVNRPTATRGGTRGGLRGRGKPGLGFRAAPRAAESSNGDAKSNEDFRAMLLGKKE